METTSVTVGSGRFGLLRRIDGLLRQLAGGGEGDSGDGPSVRELCGIALACAATYGIAMGLYAATTRGFGGVAQVLAAAVKVPLLFALTIAVTFPSFYVLCAVGGTTSSARQLLRVQLAGTALATALLASLAPVTAFFTLSTDSHGFMVLLSAVFFAAAGVLGLRVVWARGQAVVAGHGEGAPKGLGLLRAWILVAVVVAGQSAWILRPLVGEPGAGFVLFEPRESNAFAGFLETLRAMVQ